MSDFQRGHVKELQKVYDELYPSLHIQGKVMGASNSVIRDSIQDVFLVLLERKTVWEKVDNYKAYLRVALRHRIAKQLKVHFSELDEKLMDPVKSYESYLIAQQSTDELKENLQQAILSLTKSQRSIIKMRFYDGLNYNEIAEQEGISVRTVYNQFHAAIKTLRSNNIDRF